jgi:predicted kinase
VDTHERLLAAVLLQAVRDAQSKRPQLREPAIAWLHSPGASNVCDWLGVDVEQLRKKL